MVATSCPPLQERCHLGRVLVVDDDNEMRTLCARVLTGEGWIVTVADHGRAAIAELETSRVTFDCVVCDINMPELDGFGLMRALRARDEDLPVLLMTGAPSLDGAVRAIDYGAVSYLTKPFDPERLASAVARAAHRHGVMRVRRHADVFATDGDGELAQQFSRAVDRSWMAFQPILDITKRSVFAYEALLRTDEESLRRTDVFIATAERLHRIEQLGRNVRAAVARTASDAPPGALLFVNVHGGELLDEELFAGDSALAKHASRVVLEITEHTAIDPTFGATRIAMLRKLGYRIAIDDLGAGHAGLAMLTTLEPEIVKLDMSLIRDLDQHPTKRRVVAAIAALSLDLGSQLIAEGVETDAERMACVDAGIVLMQGYLFARPQRGFASITW